jgi:hypothetical protein
MRALLLSQLLIPSLVMGEVVTLSWTNSTLNTDSSTIPASGPGSLVSTTIFWSICDPQGKVIITPGLDVTVPTIIPGNAENVLVNIGTPGIWCFVASHTNLEGEVSDLSNVASKTVVILPDPPTGLTVDPADTFVYEISQTANVIVLIPVGTVPEGTLCDGTMDVNGHYLVLRELVSWIGSARPPVVFAKCL